VESRLKLAVVAAALHDMHEKGIIGKYGVGGASAVAFYSEPIATKDLDIFFVFDPPQSGIILSLEPIYNYCREKGYNYDHEFVAIGGWPVQFVEAGHEPLWRDALTNAVTFSFEGASLNVLPPEHLAAMWAVVARPKDILKIQHFAENKVLEAEKMRQVLVRFGLMETWRRIQGGLPNELKF
jgi:hypothetical protein